MRGARRRGRVCHGHGLGVRSSVDARLSARARVACLIAQTAAACPAGSVARMAAVISARTAPISIPPAPPLVPRPGKAATSAWDVPTHTDEKGHGETQPGVCGGRRVATAPTASCAHTLRSPAKSVPREVHMHVCMLCTLCMCMMQRRGTRACVALRGAWRLSSRTCQSATSDASSRRKQSDAWCISRMETSLYTHANGDAVRCSSAPVRACVCVCAFGCVGVGACVGGIRNDGLGVGRAGQCDTMRGLKARVGWQRG